MGRCEVCGNDYDKTMEITLKGRVHHFDSFECAIQALAPVCAQCGVRVVGHGVEGAGSIYCGAHCAAKHGERGLADRAFPGLAGVR